MGNTTVGTITLQDATNSFIQENTCRKEAVLTPMPFYMLDSDETDVYDFGGCIKTISLNGIYIGSSVANVKTYIDSIETLVNGAQDISSGYPLIFTNDYRGTIKVKIMDVETTTVAGNPIMCTWSLKLIQASENA